MPVDLDAARAFVAGHARLLDRRRLDGDTEGVLAALDGYRNADGGYGWGLEPDLRAPGSQPIAAAYAFEVLEECGAAGEPRAAALCDWLEGVSFDDGGLPFVLPVDEPAACAPWFTGADPTTSSLHGTLAVASAAVRLVPDHPWVKRAVDHCVAGIAAAERPHAYEVLHALRLLDALGDGNLLADVAALLPPDGALHVEGGQEDEFLRPLDYAPRPGTPVRAHVDPAVLEADLDRLEGLQQDDGGWAVDFASFSSAAAIEWRGIATVRALTVLRANGRL